MNTHSASRVVCLVHHHADNPPPVCHAKPEAGAQESRAVKAVSRGVLAPRYEASRASTADDSGLKGLR